MRAGIYALSMSTWHRLRFVSFIRPTAGALKVELPRGQMKAIKAFVKTCRLRQTSLTMNGKMEV
ncbi:hypothetical protein JOM56_011271 [Amanita muscaria]